MSKLFPFCIGWMYRWHKFLFVTQFCWQACAVTGWTFQFGFAWNMFLQQLCYTFHTALNWMLNFWVMQAYQTITAAAMRIKSKARLPKLAPTIDATFEVDCTQVGLHRFAVLLLSENIWISVDAVRFPLSDEYTIVVVKMRVSLSAEQVTWDSSISEGVKSHEHISWIASATPASNTCMETFYGRVCTGI